ncbi:MAG TPA: L,D-transpeptidase family protein, partial [Gammaproteobacteria bacterium]|nr:L,D-transpeptidase family protein [Gammaproteobacteria bacterium]
GSYEVVDGNASHGCVRLKVQDAEWLRFNFVSIGTKVVVLPY